MKNKITLVSILFLLGSMCLTAEKQIYNRGESAIHMVNGKMVVLKLVDWGNRKNDLRFKNGTKIFKTQIWMMNFINRDWNYPTERSRLSRETDTVFLKNGDVVHDIVVDFSSRRRVFEFVKHKAVHISKVKRVYFRVYSDIPEVYKKRLKIVPMRKKIPVRRRIKKVN